MQENKLNLSHVTIPRPTFNFDDVEAVLLLLEDKIMYRMRQKGNSVLASDYETFGVVDNEVSEYREAIHQKLDGTDKDGELLDIAWAALLGIISRKYHNGLATA